MVEIGSGGKSTGHLAFGPVAREGSPFRHFHEIVKSVGVTPMGAMGDNDPYG